MSSNRRQIATEIAKRYTQEGTGYADRLYQLAFAVETALKERDERAARIADNRAKELRRMATAALLDDETATQFKTQADACDKLAVTIRNEDTNA